jgi:magnesium transporter
VRSRNSARAEVHDAQVIVDCAVYERGIRVATMEHVGGVRELVRDRDAFVWIGLVEPTPEEFESVCAEFHLHELAVEDALKAHQRPKVEHYGDTLFLVLKTVGYIDAEEVVEIGEVMLFVADDFLISVRHGAAGGIGAAREELERRPELLALGPSAALHALVDHIVDGYQPAIAAVEADIADVEDTVFSGTGTNPVERIYTLRRELLQFSTAVAPMESVLDALRADPLLAPMQDYMRNVADHLARVHQEVERSRELLGGILQANLTRVSVRQNEDVRKISAWAAIIAVPTLISGVYGMNFEHMPELTWRFGYPLALLLMAAACGLLYVRFRRSGWL